ncbi:MAG TPA: hypothetical protein ENG03_02040, partial [Thioploca sp.]|nr:hypothetical protein [Thioploca sp.]
MTHKASELDKTFCETIKFDETFCLELKQFCANENVTSYVALLAALKILLLRYTEQEDIIVDILPTESAQKTEPTSTDSEPVVLRTSLTDNPTAKILLSRMTQTV